MAAAAYPIPRYRAQLPYDLSQYDPNNPDQDQRQVGGDTFNPQDQAAPQDSQGGIYGNPSATLPGLNLDPEAPIHNLFYQNSGRIAAGQDQLNQEAIAQLQHYGPRQTQQEGLSDAALQQLRDTPGFTPDETSKIGVDYGQNRTSDADLGGQFLTQDEQSRISGDPNRPLEAAYTGTANEGAQLNAYGQNLSGQVGNYANYTGSAVDRLRGGLDTAVGNLGTGLDRAQDKFGKLDTAVNDPGLAFDPNSTEKQLTDADVQEMKTAAGTRIGNQYRSAEDDLQRRAAAAGNTSPLAIAAANARLQTQEASQQGDAETNADIAARQAQYERAAGIEGQREGAVGRRVGLQAGAATTEEQAAQNAAALAGTTGVNAAGLEGTQGIAAAERVGQAGIDAANTYGQTAIGEQNVMTGQQTAAQSQAERDAAARAAALATNRQNTQTGVNATRYGQGMQTQQATSRGAETVGGARIAGQGAYRSGVAQQEGMAQQGGQQAINQQLGAYGTATGGINQSTANRATYEHSGKSLLGQVIGGVLAEGGVVTEPTVALIGEKGPEMVLPFPRYRRQEAA